MNFKDLFINSCVGVITAASVGTFTQVYELKTSLAVIQEDIARGKHDLSRLNSDLERVRGDVLQTTLDIVRIKGRCEKCFGFKG